MNRAPHGFEKSFRRSHEAGLLDIDFFLPIIRMIVTKASGLAQSFDATVIGDLRGLKAIGLNVYALDTYDLLDDAKADPAAFGFTNVNDPCWTGNFTSRSSGTLCSDPNQYLFWDEVHPTAAASELTADFAYDTLTGAFGPNVSIGENISSAVPEPSTWAMMLAGFAGLGYASFRSSGRKAVAIA